MLTKDADPKVGDFGLLHVNGLTGVAISAGQALIGSGSFYTHAFVYVGDGMIAQAQPGGVEITTLAEACAGRKVRFSDFALTDSQRFQIATGAKALEGTPYSFADYAAIGAARLLGTKRLERYVSDSGHLICSQLVDLVYREAGFDLFPGRLPGDVTPGDLARLIGA